MSDREKQASIVAGAFMGRGSLKGQNYSRIMAIIIIQRWWKRQLAKGDHHSQIDKRFNQSRLSENAFNEASLKREYPQAMKYGIDENDQSEFVDLESLSAVYMSKMPEHLRREFNPLSDYSGDSSSMTQNLA